MLICSLFWSGSPGPDSGLGRALCKKVSHVAFGISMSVALISSNSRDARLGRQSLYRGHVALQNQFPECPISISSRNRRKSWGTLSFLARNTRRFSRNSCSRGIIFSLTSLSLASLTVIPRLLIRYQTAFANWPLESRSKRTSRSKLQRSFTSAAAV